MKNKNVVDKKIIKSLDQLEGFNIGDHVYVDIYPRLLIDSVVIKEIEPEKKRLVLVYETNVQGGFGTPFIGEPIMRRRREYFFEGKELIYDDKLIRENE